MEHTPCLTSDYTAIIAPSIAMITLRDRTGITTHWALQWKARHVVLALPRHLNWEWGLQGNLRR